MLAMLVALAAAATPPLALRVEVQPLGSGPQGTVVGVAIQVAPEDLKRAGERLRVSLALVHGGATVDAGDAVVDVQPDGSAVLYRDWPVGEAELRLQVASLDGAARGGWSGPVVVPEMAQRFEPAAGSAPDAAALAPSPPESGAVHFKPPVRSGGIEGLELEVEAPAATARVEFYRDGQLLFQRRRLPWTVAVALGKTAARTTVKAMAYAADGSFLGEDALVLNAAGGRIPVEILLGPEPAAGEGRRVTVAVGGRSRLAEVVLRADDRAIARWTECPCVASVPAATMAGTKVLSADATGLDGLRGNAVKVLGATGYQEAVRVEAVELPVTVLDGDGKLVAGLPQASFKVFEDGVEVPLDSFSTTADLPLALGILVDTSGSMLPVFAGVREAVAGFASQLLRPGDHYFLMTFSFEPKLQVEWSGDPQGLAGALGRVTPDGGTSLYDAVVRALELFRGRRGRSALALLSDGDDTTSRTPWAAALRYAKTARVPVYTIGYGISKLEFGVRRQLEDLAGATGADVFYVAKKGGELAGVYRRIDQELRAQYLLAYRSPSTRGPDTFRKVRVEVAGRGLTARTIAGYYPVE